MRDERSQRGKGNLADLAIKVTKGKAAMTLGTLIASSSWLAFMVSVFSWANGWGWSDLFLAIFWFFAFGVSSQMTVGVNKSRNEK